jgi:hypothetical protein
MLQIKFVCKLKTHFIFNNDFFFFENRAVYVMTWKNIVQLSKPQMTTEYGASALHAEYLSTNTQTQNM